jgi:hypothetical protein
MVHRTDIAGRVGRSTGQVRLGDGGICRHAPGGALTEGALIEGALIEKVIYRKPLFIRGSAARSAAVSS